MGMTRITNVGPERVRKQDLREREGRLNKLRIQKFTGETGASNPSSKE